MNRQQAKLLAPIICAFAAGSAIQLKSKTGTGATFLLDQPDVDMHFDSLGKYWEASIAPKPPKVKEAKLALVLGGECTAIVTKGKWELMEKSPDFLKWISEPFKLLPSDKRTHA